MKRRWFHEIRSAWQTGFIFLINKAIINLLRIIKGKIISVIIICGVMKDSTTTALFSLSSPSLILLSTSSILSLSSSKKVIVL
ncbi:putative cyclic pyranopterin monophosphate synthase [Dirofilaria immitis]